MTSAASANRASGCGSGHGRDSGQECSGARGRVSQMCACRRRGKIASVQADCRFQVPGVRFQGQATVRTCTNLTSDPAPRCVYNAGLGQRAGSRVTAPARNRRETPWTRLRVREATYSTAARHFHWWTVALLAIQVPVGLYMVYRRQRAQNIWDGLTNTLYSSHKTLGLVILALVIARLALPPRARRARRRADHHLVAESRLARHPLVALSAADPGAARRLARHLALRRARGVRPRHNPAAGRKNAEAYEPVRMLHKYLAYLTVALIAMHVGAAVVLHYLIRGDGVLARMIPWVGRRGQVSDPGGSLSPGARRRPGSDTAATAAAPACRYARPEHRCG